MAAITNLLLAMLAQHRNDEWDLLPASSSLCTLLFSNALYANSFLMPFKLFLRFSLTGVGGVGGIAGNAVISSS
jgi:hypothetical protein